jgi:hypothetical protein
MTVSVEAWMLLSAFGFGFIAGATATVYWFLHGVVFGALEEIEDRQ